MTLAMVKTALSAKLYDELTDGDDTVTDRCIEAGTLRAEGLFSVVKVTLDPEHPLHREIIRNLTIYEMFAFNGDSKGGKEYLTAATDLVSVNYGNVEAIQKSYAPIGAIKAPGRRRL